MLSRYRQQAKGLTDLQRFWVIITNINLKRLREKFEEAIEQARQTDIMFPANFPVPLSLIKYRQMLQDFIDVVQDYSVAANLEDLMCIFCKLHMIFKHPTQ